MDIQDWYLLAAVLYGNGGHHTTLNSCAILRILPPIKELQSPRQRIYCSEFKENFLCFISLLFHCFSPSLDSWSLDCCMLFWIVFWIPSSQSLKLRSTSFLSLDQRVIIDFSFTHFTAFFTAILFGKSWARLQSWLQFHTGTAPYGILTGLSLVVLHSGIWRYT